MWDGFATEQNTLAGPLLGDGFRPVAAVVCRTNMRKRPGGEAYSRLTTTTVNSRVSRQPESDQAAGRGCSPTGADMP